MLNHAQQLSDALMGSRDVQSHLIGVAGQAKPEKTQEYDPYKSPPDLDLAINHGLAKRVYKMPEHKHFSLLHKEVCPCCGINKAGEPIPLRSELEEMYHLGSGYALYFKLIQYSIAILGVFFLISGFFNIISNAATGDCLPVDQAPTTTTNQCVQDFAMTLSIANKKDHPDLLAAQMVLNMIAVIAMFPLFQYFRYQLRKMNIDADDKTVTPSDYTIQVTGLEASLTNEEIIQWIEKLHTEEQHVKVAKVNRTYDVAQYIELKNKKDMLETLRRQVFNFEKKNSIEAEAEQAQSELERLIQDGLQRTQTVLITFDKADQAAFVIGEYAKAKSVTIKDRIKVALGFSKKEFHGMKVFIERAPEPTDILWENLNYGAWDKFKKRMVTKSAAALLIIMSCGVIVLINWAQGEAMRRLGQKSHIVEGLSALGSILIVVINTLLGMAIRTLSQHEKHGSFTSYFTGVAEKLSGAQFINTAFTTLLAQIALYNTFRENGFEAGLYSIPFYGKGGLVENMFSVFISNAFLTPLLAFFDFGYFFKLYKRRKVIKMGDNNTNMTQQEAQKLFEEPEMDLAVKNSLMVKTMLMTAFFAPAVPMAMVFAMLGLFANYWVDKYLLLRRNVLPISLRNELCDNMLENMELMGCLFGFGNLLFMLGLEITDPTTGNTTCAYETIPKGVIYATVILGTILGLLPSEAINEKYLPIVDEVTEHNTYNGIRAEFSTDYAIQNPVTAQEALKEQSQLLSKKKTLIPKIRKNLRQGAAKLLSEQSFAEAFSRSKTTKKIEVPEDETPSTSSSVLINETSEGNESKAEIKPQQAGAPKKGPQPILGGQKPKLRFKGILKAAQKAYDDIESEKAAAAGQKMFS